MRLHSRSRQLALRAPTALVVVAALAPATAVAGPSQHSPLSKRGGHGALIQLRGARGCLADRSAPVRGCGTARALKGPGPFMGSRAIALSPNGKHAYVASLRSDAIAIFRRNPRTGALSQPRGEAGCVARKAAAGCAAAVGLNGPNSVAVSPDGGSVYATSRGSNSIAIFHRDRSTGALTQLPAAAGCISGLPVPVCARGRALLAPDVVVVSPDGKNVYVGSFFGNAVAAFNRNARTGALVQPEGATGCIAETTSDCTPGIALGAPEGMAISADGSAVYVAGALSNSVAVLVRDSATGALAQAGDGSGCIVAAALGGCTTGVQLSGANAVAVAPFEGNVYVTSLFSNSVTSFGRVSSATNIAQKAGTAGCLVWLRAVGCSFGRALSSPEGLAVSPDGRNVYLAAFATGAIDVLDRSRRSGTLTQKPGRPGCLALRSVPGCNRGRALRGVSSIALSPDGRFLYSTSFASNAVDIFRRSQ